MATSSSPLRLVCYPNSGERYLGLVSEEGAAADEWAATDTSIESVTAAEFASAGAAWHMAGATVLGGCCRVGPQDIAALSEAFPLSEPHLAVVA